MVYHFSLRVKLVSVNIPNTEKLEQVTPVLQKF